MVLIFLFPFLFFVLIRNLLYQSILNSMQLHDLYLYFRGKAPEGPARPAGGRMMARRELPKNLLAIDWWRIK